MFDVAVSLEAQQCFENIIEYISSYDKTIAGIYIDRLESVIQSLREQSFVWSYFFATGAPYRGRLFKVGTRTSYWIVYSISEED